MTCKCRFSPVEIHRMLARKCIEGDNACSPIDRHGFLHAVRKEERASIYARF